MSHFVRLLTTKRRAGQLVTGIIAGWITLGGVVLVGGTAAVATGCGSGIVHLSHDEFERLPRDSRQEIFDAENDLVIARNKQDDAVEKRDKAERSLDDLDARRKRAATRLNASGQGGKISQAGKMFDSERAFLDSEVDVAKAEIDATEAGTELSRARLQLVRARQLARIGRATLADLKPLEEKVASFEARTKASGSAETNLRAKAQSQLDAWKAAQDAYARSNNDYDTGTWGD